MPQRAMTSSLSPSSPYHIGKDAGQRRQVASAVALDPEELKDRILPLGHAAEIAHLHSHRLYGFRLLWVRLRISETLAFQRAIDHYGRVKLPMFREGSLVNSCRMKFSAATGVDEMPCVLAAAKDQRRSSIS
jgi:hypothetical protein